MSLTCPHLWAGDPVWHHQASVREDTLTVPSPFVFGTFPLGSMNGLGIVASVWLQDQLERANQEASAEEWRASGVEGLLPNSNGRAHQPCILSWGNHSLPEDPWMRQRSCLTVGQQCVQEEVAPVLQDSAVTGHFRHFFSLFHSWVHNLNAEL